MVGSASAMTAAMAAGVMRWFTGARAQPSRPAAKSDSRNAGWFGPSHAMRSPPTTPSSRRPLARRRIPSGELPVRDPSGADDQGDVIRGDPGPTLDPGADPEVHRVDPVHDARMPNMSERRCARPPDTADDPTAAGVPPMLGPREAGAGETLPSTWSGIPAFAIGSRRRQCPSGRRRRTASSPASARTRRSVRSGTTMSSRSAGTSARWARFKRPRTVSESLAVHIMQVAG